LIGVLVIGAADLLFFPPVSISFRPGPGLVSFVSGLRSPGWVKDLLPGKGFLGWNKYRMGDKLTYT
jgi:hypothetical protein